MLRRVITPSAGLLSAGRLHSSWAPSTKGLDQLLRADPDTCEALADAMSAALTDAQGSNAKLPLFPPQMRLVQEVCHSATKNAPALERVESFLAFNDKLVRWVPTLYSDTQELVMTNVYNHILAQHFVYSHADTGNDRLGAKRELLGNAAFREWMRSSAQDWGNFCDTPGSVTRDAVESMEQSQKAFDPDFRMNMHQYMAPPSGYQTWNQLFARHTAPAWRPVDYVEQQDTAVVSPADSVFKESFFINDKGQVCDAKTHLPCKCTVKGRSYGTIEELLGSDRAVDKETAKKFYGGHFYHSFLGPADYHRFRAPLRGFVRTSKSLTGHVYLQVNLKNASEGDIANKYNPEYRYFTAPDDADAKLGNPSTWQFRQQRGLLLLDTNSGLMAVLPIGMAQVSGVHMTAEKGSVLAKGEEFGYFAFGGSDIITVYNKDAEFQPDPEYKKPEGSQQKRLANNFIGTVVNHRPTFNPFKHELYNPKFPVPKSHDNHGVE